MAQQCPYKDELHLAVDSANNVAELLPFLGCIYAINDIQQFIHQKVDTMKSMPPFLIDHISESVLSMTHLNKAIKYLKWIPIDEIKKFISQKLNTTNSTSAKTIYFNSFSMNNIIPSDAIQHILSFLPSWSDKTKLVNKEWNKLSNQNQKNLYSKSHEIHNKNNIIPYNSKINKTWIIHPGYRSLYHRFRTISQHRNSNDRIFIHAGQYKFKYAVEISRTISMIGIENGVNIKNPYKWQIGAYSPYRCDSTIKCHLENINFQINDKDNIRVCKNNSLYLRKCKLNLTCAGAAILVKNGATLIVEDCVFETSSGGMVAIKIEQEAKKVVIEDSHFRNFRPKFHGNLPNNACIEILSIQRENRQESIGGSLELECVRNCFENNVCYPIAQRIEPGVYDEETVVSSGEHKPYFYSLESNVVWRNQLISKDLDGKLKDANKINHIVEITGNNGWFAWT